MRRSRTLEMAFTASLILLLLVGLPGSAWSANGGGASGEEAVEDPEAPENAPAEEQASDMPGSDGTLWGTVQLDGTFRIGVRAVDVDGRDAKFREDIDLDDGPRLLDTRITIRPLNRAEGRWFDRITLAGDGLGGDPYEAWSIGAYKTGAYKFEVRNRTTDFFWSVPGFHHAWDLTRTITDARLSVTPVEDLELHATFDRFRQDRFRTTTRDISRDEFVFEEPLDQDGSSYGFGVRWSPGTTQVFFDQEIRSFNDNGGFGLSGFDDGLTPGEAFLTFFEQKEVRSFDAPVSRGGVHTVLADGKLELGGDVLYSKQSMGFSFARLWEGANFQDREVTVNESALGEAEREILHGNVSVRVMAHERVFLQAKYRRRSFDQDGNTDAAEFQVFQDGAVSVAEEALLSSYEITHDQFLFGGEVIPVDEFSFFAELGVTSRDQMFEHGEPGEEEPHEPVTTDTTAFRIGANVRPDPRFDVNFTYDRGDIDDPFTRISPTEADKLRVKVRVRPRAGWTLGGHVTHRSVENTVSGSMFDTTGFGFNLSYTGSDRGWFNAGFTRLDADTEVPIRFIFPFFGNFVEDTALYTSEDNTFLASGQIRVAEDVPVDVFGRMVIVDSSGTLPLQFQDMSVGLRYTFEQGFFLDLEGRFIEYTEDSELPSRLDDYDAGIVTVGFGYAFD